MKSTLSTRNLAVVLAASAAALSACHISSTAQTAPDKAPAEASAATEAALAGPRYKLQRIADLNVGEGAVAMNNRGQVLLGTEGSDILLWQEGKVRKLPAVATTASARRARRSRRSRKSRGARKVAIWDAHSINDRGQIVGLAADGQACVYEKGRLRLLGALSASKKWDASAMNPRGDTSHLDINDAQAINEAGDIVGTSHTPSAGGRIYNGPDAESASQSWMLRKAGAGGAAQVQGGKYGVYAQDINDAGQVAGTFRPDKLTVDGFPINHAFVWSVKDGKLRDLGEGDANAINDRGQVVGGNGDVLNDVSAKALLWENGQGRELGLGKAKAINNLGQIVGIGRENNKSKSRAAALWQDGQQIFLKDRLDRDYKVRLEEACLINDRGQIVVEAYPTWGALAFYALLTPIAN